MDFLVDAQQPPALARWLVSKGHSASHVADIGLLEAQDVVIWRHALSAGSIILTKDEDFARLKRFHPDGPRVVWLRVPNTRRGPFLAWFETILPHLLDALNDSEELIEIALRP